MALSQVYSAVAGHTITADRWNNEFGNIYGNGTDLAFPLTKAVSFAGYTITWDAAAVTSIVSSASQAFQVTPGVKTGTPSTTGGFLNFVAATYTDNNTAGSGTATAWASVAIQRPTLAATNASVVTTDAATLYIANSPAEGTNDTITNEWAVWVDAGESRFDAGLGGIGAPCLNELRLTLATATPVTTGDVTAAGTIYLTPYTGSHISLYSGSQWHTYSTAEVSLALTVTSGKPYDIWAYNNAGTVTLEVLVWTDDTNRATALAYQNGVLVKSGDATRRYLGSLYATASNQTEDSFAKRNLWNYYNRVARPMQAALETADTWTYSTAAWQQANANAANQIEYVQGVSESPVRAWVRGASRNGTGEVKSPVGIGIDSTTANSARLMSSGMSGTTVNVPVPQSAEYNGYPGVGQHILAWIEYSTASGTTTWYGDGGAAGINQMGIMGEVWG